ncbi:MAG: Sau3AI family type II restriction endonuclease [Culicoidibacterales bacterium]
MSEPIYTTVEELLEKATETEGKTMRQIDKFNRLDNLRNKGALGQMIEESHFGYAINSKSQADFENLGIELKVTALKLLKNGDVSVKERLVLNIINYMEEYKKTFQTSSYMNKSKNILLIFYLWDDKIKNNDYQIIKSHLFTIATNDLFVIENDWNTIIQKIKAGLAHEISEADTDYLAACTKGASAKSVKIQPFSNIPAKQRAFSYKVSYMNTVARGLINPQSLKPFAQPGSLKNTTLSELLHEKFRPYYGKSITEITNTLNAPISSTAKNALQLITSAILGVTSTSLDKIEEFSKANIKIKTIRLTTTGNFPEHMSFPTFKFLDIINESWETSKLYQLFTTQKYLFVIFQYDNNNVLHLKKIKLWNMPYSVLENEVKATWLETVRVINEGVILTPKGKKMSNNLPGSKYNNVCHVRPHAQNASDAFPLPDGRFLTKQGFWLDKSYLRTIIL